MSRRFIRDDCAAPTVYCGKGKLPRKRIVYTGRYPSYYTKKGNSYECLQKGIGAGTAIANGKKLKPSSLQNIKYIGPVYEAKFRKKGVRTLKGLEKKASSLGGKLIKWLESVLIRKNGGVDRRAVNMTLLYLHDKGIDVPSCTRMW